jgi:hypothetical protein
MFSMNSTRRKTLLALAALVPSALAGVARAETQLVKVGQVFPYLDMYLGLPAAQRSRFALGYLLMRNGRPATGVKLTLVGAGGGRTLLPVGDEGLIRRLPGLDDFRQKARVEIVKPDAVKVSLSMVFLARMAASASLDAREVAAAIQQCDSVIRAKAGLIGFAVPKIRRAVFRDGGSATAIDAKGVSRPLPMMGGHPAFDPGQMQGTVTVKLARTPSAILLDERPKS